MTPVPTATPPTVPPAPTTPRAGEPAPTASQEVVEKRVEQTQNRAAAVAQDILLVPKTVFVPYMAQVPLGPVRISSVTQVSTGVQSRELLEQRISEQRVSEQRIGERNLERREEPRSSLNDELLRSMRSLNERLDTIENQQKKQASLFQGGVCPTPAPGMPKVPCKDTVVIPQLQ